MINTQERLNMIKEKVQSADFLEGKNLGGDISYHIFDYPPEDELMVRDGIELTVNSLAKSNVNIQVIDLFDLVLEILEGKNLISKVIKIELKLGSDKMLSKLKPMIKKEKIAEEITKKVHPEAQAIFLTGIGSVYPLIRSHEILNNLHAFLDDKPLIVFFPGAYDMQSLKLFNCLSDNNYYRAFRLIS